MQAAAGIAPSTINQPPTRSSPRAALGDQTRTAPGAPDAMRRGRTTGTRASPGARFPQGAPPLLVASMELQGGGAHVSAALVPPSKR